MEPWERFQALPFDNTSDRVVKDREWARWVRNFLLAAIILTIVAGVFLIIH